MTKSSENTMPDMKIQDAQELFETWGSSLRSGYDALIDSNIASATDDPLQNDNYCHALFYTDRMFRDTDNTLRMLSGEGGDCFLSTLYKSLEKALQRITNNGGFARVILIAKSIPAVLTKLQSQYPCLEIIRASAENEDKVSHTIICDDHMLREEEPHKPVTLESDASVIRANVFFGSTLRAGVATTAFDNTWGDLSGDSK